MATYTLKNSRIYRAWFNMKRRCKGATEHNRKYYSDRGITVCEEWQQFKPFLAWATANGYRDDLTLDRIDPNKGYYPENCRWVNYTVQNSHLTRKAGKSGERNIRKVWKTSYEVRFHRYGKEIIVGYYKTLNEAVLARDQWRAENDHY